MMGQGLQFAQLATLVGKRHGARWGTRRVTLGAVGWRDGERFVMGTFSDGTVVLGEPQDFWVPVQKQRPSGARQGEDTPLRTLGRKEAV